jgi:hypothetical protein
VTKIVYIGYGQLKKMTPFPPPSFMKFCPVAPEICHGQVHGARKKRRRIRIIIIIRRNGAKTISLRFQICWKGGQSHIFGFQRGWGLL